MKLKNITYNEYKELSAEKQGQYNFAIMYAKECESQDPINFGLLYKKTFGEVKDIQAIVTKENIFDSVYCYFEKSFVSLGLFQYAAFFHYICEQIELICNIEKKALEVELDQASIDAGVEVFEKFGSLLQIDKLAGGDVAKYDNVRALPYEYCLTKLALNATEYNFNKTRTDIITRNAKLYTNNRT